MGLSRYKLKLGVMFDFGDALARLGTDPRIQVGAVLFPVDCSSVLGIGYNGAASGLDHESVMAGATQLGRGTSGAAHAEANVLVKAGGGALDPGRPCILYCTLMPCPYCAPLIANCPGLVGVVYGEERDDVVSGRAVLERAGLEVVNRFDATAGKVDDVVGWWRSLRPGRPARKVAQQ